MAELEFDVVVIGAGPGGYVAAIRAAQLGLKVAIVEREHMGGVCLNWGCIPTKALLRSAEVYTLMKHAADFGLKADNITFDIKAVVERSRKIADQLSGGIGFLMKKNKVTTFMGNATLLAKGTATHVEVVTDGSAAKTIKASHIILATGARARTLPALGLEPDGKYIWTAREAMVPEAMPKSVLVIGSGAIGMEFASFYNAFGAQVSVVEMVDRILPAEDIDISAFAKKSFEKQGVSIATKASIEKVTLPKGKAAAVTVDIKDAKGVVTSKKVERVILAVGITGNVENIGLEKAGIKTDRGHVIVNQWLETGRKGVYAIGDLVGPPWLAHKASHEAIICVEKIAGIKDVHPLEASLIPGCTYCNPQVASVGLSEDAAIAEGYDVKVGRFPFHGNGKAIALGEAEGLVKTIFDKKTGELLGAHMIGTEVTELIQGFGIAKSLEVTETDLFHTVFPHPTLSEMMHESALDAYNKALHI